MDADAPLAQLARTKKDGADIAQQIRDRSLRVRGAREWIGFFEFAVWCFLRRRNILLNMGAAWVSVDDLYPALRSRTRGPESQEAIHIAATYWDQEMNAWGAIHDAYRHKVQHYVIAFPVGKPSSDESVFRRLGFQLKALGHMLILTDTRGDCGIDALSYHDNNFQHTSPTEWK